MTVWFFLLILISVCLAAAAQLLLKAGMSTPVAHALLSGSSSKLHLVTFFIKSPLLLLGILCFGVSFFVWLIVLSKIEVSQAYPFIALGIVVTSVGGYFLFGEDLNHLRVIGIGTIIIGIVVISQS